MEDVDKLKRDVQILIDHNLWRRDNEDKGYKMANPGELGVAIETAIECMEKLIIVSEG